MYSESQERYQQAWAQKQELNRPTLNQEDGAPLLKLGTEDDGSEIEGARSPDGPRIGWDADLAADQKMDMEAEDENDV